ncbi:MarR family winged helix-turn-helix transcriptional regulator [Fusibacter ferrireducens]|uniref:HTH-type transcriptional regulator SarZ n=1 Tax=Fusibacter ferrireducens TaxID=2785058 RepID=A0ABR9ZQ87_9FIRM|nr:MarR family transcriptional regulator [Fusibacter ferrireducens]MBF4692481.1 MarR family transcriptional regulator [Fusibacter ferrireducens]
MAKEENIDTLKLDNQLCFRFYLASRLTTKLYKPLLDQLNLTYPQYLVMLILWEMDAIQIKVISEKIFLDTNTLTPLLKRLESNGLITRTRSCEDERQVIIRLTDQGKDLKQLSKPIPLELYNHMLSSGDINEEDFKALSRLLDQFTSAMLKSKDL